MVRAIIFDLYGVLALNGWQAFKAAHFAGREEAWKQIYELGRQVDAGLSDYTDLVRTAARAADESAETVRYQLEHTAANAELLDFIKRDLRGAYKLGILSNASNDGVIGRIFAPAQQALFGTIIMSHHVGMTKPDVHMYKVAAGRLGVEVEECIFIDDQERYVAGAQAAGMRALLYTDVAALKKELANLA